MPNTLAHFGIQSLISQSATRRIDIKWVLVGCIIPDIPWIIQRLAKFTLNSVEVYDLRLYAIAQASLICCLILAGALALLTNNSGHIFILLSLNSILHLLLDSLQIKWANGIHLFAPITWDLLNFGWFWPDSLPTYVLTALGLTYIIWNWKVMVAYPVEIVSFSLSRTLLILILLAGYFLLPMALMNGPKLANNHFVRTLSDPSQRPGKIVEFDRVFYESSNKKSGTFKTFYGDTIQVVDAPIGHSGVFSFRVRFLTSDTVQIIKLHNHSRWFRETASLVGLSLFVIIWMIGLVNNCKWRLTSEAKSG